MTILQCSVDIYRKESNHNLHFFSAIQRAALLFLVSICVVCIPTASHAEQTCAWLNAATAGGFLEGPVTSTVTPTSKSTNDVTCEFVRQDGKLVSKLRIEVNTVEKPHDTFASDVAHCGKQPAPIIAVGNEAMVCSRKAKDHQTTERIVGRVRDRIFLLDISSNAPDVMRPILRDKAEKISEQVAGILF